MDADRLDERERCPGGVSVNFAIGEQVAARELRGLAALAPRLVIHAPAGTPVFVDGQLAGTGPEVSVELGAH